MSPLFGEVVFSIREEDEDEEEENPSPLSAEENGSSLSGLVELICSGHLVSPLEEEKH